MTKEVESLVADLEHLITTKELAVDEERKEELITEYVGEIEAALRNFLEEKEDHQKPTLRMSNIGHPQRKLWYELNEEQEREQLPANLLMSFLQGHIMEAVLLMLTEMSGHTVEMKQEEIVVEGIKGHIDAVIDGVLIDVKTASPYSYQQKFVNGKLLNGDDPYGYNMQIQGYAAALGMEKWGWLAFNKATGEQHLLVEETFINNAPEQIVTTKKLMNVDTPPDRCYPDQIDGKGGNRILGKECSWCYHKFKCWENLRAFKYSNGVRYFSHVEKEPKVEELTLS